MEKLIAVIKSAFAVIGAAIGGFIGGVDGLVYTLLAFVLIDYASGVFLAVKNKALSSEVGFKGIFCKVMIFFLVGVGNMLDMNVLGGGAVLRTAVIFFYIANEGISILENAAALGLPVPEKLQSILAQLKDKK